MLHVHEHDEMPTNTFGHQSFMFVLDDTESFIVV